MKGVVPDMLSAIKEQCTDYDIDFETVIYDDYRNMIDDLKSGKIDLASPIYADYWNADQQGFFLTNTFMSTTMLMLNEGSYSPDKIKKVGIDQQSPLQTVYAEIHASEYEWVSYPSMGDAARALARGDVDGTLCSACSYHVFAKKDDVMKNVNRVTLPEKVNLSMAVTKQNPELRSFMNRCIAMIGETRIFNSLAVNSNVEGRISITEFISQNPLSSIIVFSLIVLLLVGIIVRLYKANEKAKRDSMTGLLNKEAMEELITARLRSGGVLLMIDIDNFKTINDVLGHKAGDQVIDCLAACLRSTFRHNDVIGRFGGDEFLVFLPDTQCDDDTIAKKVRSIQAALCECSPIADSSEVQCSVSVGVLRVKPDSKMTFLDAFEKADSALYDAKKRGKGTFATAE